MRRWETSTKSHTMTYRTFSLSIHPTNGSISEEAKGAYNIIPANLTARSVKSHSCKLLKKINKASKSRSMGCRKGKIRLQHGGMPISIRLRLNGTWKHVKNFPISVTGIKNAYTIFGPNIGSLRGKTVRKTETVMLDYMAIPKQIKYKMKTIELTVDVMFVYNTLFVISLGKILNSPQSRIWWIVNQLPY